VSDPESDLLYYNARYYNPTLKTFTSADPASAFFPEELVDDPQQLNPYSYVANNPVKYVDPDGELLHLAPLLIYGAFAAYDAYSTSKTILDPNVSNGQKIFTVGLTVSQLGKVKTLAKATEQVVKKGAQIRSNPNK
jgi:insecticidal toxin complex protein TccC